MTHRNILFGGIKMIIRKYKNYTYVVTPRGSVILEYNGGEIDCIKVPTKLGGKPVVACLDEIFSGTYAKEVIFPKTFLGFLWNLDHEEEEFDFYGSIGISSSLERVVLGEHTRITTDMFNGCENLKEITMPKTIDRIDVNAFAYCKSLDMTIDYPEIKTIGFGAFKGCENIKVKVPDTLESIGVNTFEGCKPENIEMSESLKLKISNKIIFEGFNSENEENDDYMTIYLSK